MPVTVVPPVRRAEGDPYTSVAAALWQQREALEQLLYRLVQQHHVLAFGRTRWYVRAAVEVCASLEAVRLGEVLRAAQVAPLAGSLGLPPDCSLGELVTAAPQPWSFLLGEHRDALQALVAEVETAANDNRRLDASVPDVRQLSLHEFLR